jgi:hypothetical protein
MLWTDSPSLRTDGPGSLMTRGGAPSSWLTGLFLGAISRPPAQKAGWDWRGCGTHAEDGDGLLVGVKW